MILNTRFAVVSVAALFAAVMAVAAVPAPLRAGEDPAAGRPNPPAHVASGGDNIASDAATGAGGDIAGARGAGLRTVWLSRGRTWPIADFLPDHQVEHPAAAIQLVINGGVRGN